MTRNQLRVLFILPLLLTVLGFVVIVTVPDQWPPTARAYLHWSFSHEHAPVHDLLNLGATVGLLGFAASTIGLALFWGPARYVYVASLLLSFGGDVTEVPQLIDGWTKLVESIAQTLVGLDIALMFTGDSARQFGGAPGR